MERSSYVRRYGDERYKESSRLSNASLLMSGFSWPPRSYTCTFCRREFRSAQALGGHMNVHRRDRARLRQSPPWNTTPPPLSNPNPNPNPNPSSTATSNHPPLPNLNFSPLLQPPPPPPRCDESSAPTSLSPLTYTIPSLLSPLNAAALSPSLSTVAVCSKRSDGETMKSARAVKALFGVEDLRDFMGEEDQDHGDGREMVKLDLEFGMREDLDLELRLGYGNY